MDHSKQLGVEKVEKLLFKLSVPAVIAMLVSASYNVIDRIFIGRAAGFLGIGGITIAFPFMLLMMAFGMLIGLGANSLISISLGEQKQEKAELVLANGAVLIIAESLFITVVGLVFLEPLLYLFGSSEQIFPYAKAYTGIILWGALFQGLSFGMNNCIRAEGNARTAMKVMLLAAIINIILDPIFIFIFDMGVGGAALATVIAQGISSVYVLHYYLKGPSVLKFRRKNFGLQASIVKRILAIGSASFARQVATSLMNVILNKSLVTYGGDIAVSAMGIVQSLLTFLLMPTFGINQGVQPIIGYNYGAQQYKRVRKALKLGIIAATAVVCVGYVVMRVFPEQLISLFSKDDEQLLSLGVYALSIASLFTPAIGIQVIGSGYFQAVGKARQALFLGLSRQVVLLIPALLILPKFYGLQGVFMATPVSDILAVLLTGAFMYTEMRNLVKA